MNGNDEKELRRLLKVAMPPFSETAPNRDLWPVLLRRLEAPSLRVPWWDWALLVAATVMFFLFPGMIPALLYHL
jgi:hypothetical protein